MSKTWKELEAENVKRCCAIFKNGHRCRRRVTAPEASWCEKHGRIIKPYEDHFKEVLKMEGRYNA